MGLYRKRGVWYFMKQFKGKKAQGCTGTTNKRMAQDLWEKKYLPSVLDGSFWAEPVIVPTMKEVIDRYMKNVSPSQKGHKRNSEIAPYFYEYLGGCPISDVTTTTFSDYKEKRLTGHPFRGHPFRGHRQAKKILLSKFFDFSFFYELPIILPMPFFL